LGKGVLLSRLGVAGPGLLSLDTLLKRGFDKDPWPPKTEVTPA
jgi:hypothetical protein